MVEVIADLQIHSKHSRATSRYLSIDNLEKYGRMKGLHLLGVGDFQHAEHRKEIDAKLKEDDKGILRTKSGFAFLWQTEISLMYKENDKRRAVHLLIFAPNTETADKITSYLSSKGRIDYDGRPIFGMSCKQVVKELKEINEKIEIIPAHCMTPWFGIFGSKSGFDSLEEAFGEEFKHIYAIESGMSADPSMLWRFKEVAERINVVSFSDAHSFWPWRIGREATVFDIEELSYENIMKAIRTGEGIKYTIETPPEYGKYHYDGHRNCDFSCNPTKTKELEGKCPKCGGNLIIGVENRVEEISVNPAGFRPRTAKPFYKLLPLHELLILYADKGIASKGNWKIYNDLIEKFGNEFNILLNVEKEELREKKVDEKLIDLIIKNRIANIRIKPGFDGTYGIAQLESQKTLF